MKEMNVQAAYNLLDWAASSIPHGGNPYCRDAVINAERIVAGHEGRTVESFAVQYERMQTINELETSK